MRRHFLAHFGGRLIGMMRRGGGVDLRAWAAEEQAAGRIVVWTDYGFSIYVAGGAAR